MDARDRDIWPDDGPPAPKGRHADDLIGLDPDDPETQAFAAHLDRMRHPSGHYTVEGYIADVGEFANSANRAGGHRRLTALILVALILAVVLIAAWETLSTVVTTFFTDWTP